MIASRNRLPKNENPRLDELDEEEKNVLAAFRIVFDGYRRAQDRTRAVIRAYNELESVASSLLRERRENRDASSPPRENNETNRGSPSSPRIDIDDELADVLLVDLTSDFDFERGERAVLESRTPSPIFGLPGKAIKTRRSAEETAEAAKSTRLGTAWNQIGTKTDSKTREGNDQDGSLLSKTAWTRKSAEETNCPGVAEATKSTKFGTARNQIGTKTDSKTREGNEQDDSPLSKTAWARKSAEETNCPGVAEATKSTAFGTTRYQIGTKTDSKTREGNDQDGSPLSKTAWARKSAEETNFPGVAEATKSTKFGTARNQIRTKTDSKTREGNEQDDSPLSKTAWARKSAEETNFPGVAEATKSTRLGTTWNQIGTKTDSKTREGNDQDGSPLSKTAWARKSAEETNFPGVAEATKSTKFGTARNQIGTKTDSKTREGNDQDGSPLSKTAWARKSAEETNFPGVAEATKSTAFGTTRYQIGTKRDNKTREGNEENSPLLCNSAASGSRDGDSRPSVKLSLTKSAYRIDKSKASSGKTTKQATLVFQPIAAKVDITCSEKIKAQSNAARHWANLFDEDYRVKKSTTERESSVATEKKDPPRVEKEKFARPAEAVSKVLGDGAAARSKTKPDGVLDNCIIMETPSQIDESARSLFEDEDLEDFQISQDFLNTCMDAPALADSAKRKEDESGAGRKIDDATSPTPKASQLLFNGLDSIDETFFAPGEFHPMKNGAKKPAESTILTPKRAGEFHPPNKVVNKPVEVSKPVAGCSTALTPKRAGDKDRSLKRKTGEESIEKDVLEDLDLRESDWDTDLWNENCPPTKRPLNNSFDIVPEKKRKSPEYFSKGKMGRGKDKFHKVTGWSCRECENYYGQMNLPEADLRRRLEACRRHTSKMPKYCTPKDFWNPEFPDSVDSSD